MTRRCKASKLLVKSSRLAVHWVTFDVIRYGDMDPAKQGSMTIACDALSGIESLTVPPPVRNHEVHSVDDLLRLLGDKAIAVEPEVFCDDVEVAVLLDRRSRIATARMELLPTQRWDMISGLAAKPWRGTPRDLVRMLRFDLHGTDIGHVIQALSRLDFVRANTARSQVAHGKESLGGSVEAEAQGIEKVPETFVLSVPIWSTPGCNQNVTVTMGIYLDVQAQVVELRTLADEVSRATNAALFALADTLREKKPDLPIFVGTP